MKKNKITADICIDINNKTLKICKLEYFEDENNNFFYVFSPNYLAINLLNKRIFCGIQGIDLTLKKKHYVRKNIVPSFISERIPKKSRTNLKELIGNTKIDDYKPLEWLKKTKTRYFGDNLYVV